MSKIRETDILYGNITVTHNVPAQCVEDDLRTFGLSLGDVLDGFIADCVARNFLPRLYRGISKTLVSEGHPKKVISEMDKKVIYESDIVHIGRIWSNGKGLQKQITALAQEQASTIPFFSSLDRGGSGRISQRALDAANKWFADGVETTKAEMIEGMIAGYKVQRDPDGNLTPEGLARGIQAFTRFIEKTSLQKLGGEI